MTGFFIRINSSTFRHYLTFNYFKMNEDPITCSVDSDCPEGYYCGAEGVCVKIDLDVPPVDPGEPPVDPNNPIIKDPIIRNP